MRVPISLQPVITYYCLPFFYHSHLSDCEVISHSNFDWHFPSDWWSWASFHVLTGHCISSLGEMSVQILCPFFIGLSLNHWTCKLTFNEVLSLCSDSLYHLCSGSIAWSSWGSNSDDAINYCISWFSFVMYSSCKGFIVILLFFSILGSSVEGVKVLPLEVTKTWEGEMTSNGGASLI